MKIVHSIGRTDFWESNGKYEYVIWDPDALSVPGSESHRQWIEMTGVDSLEFAIEQYNYFKKQL